MAVQVQFRRGTKAQHDAFTGATGEITVNTTDKTLVVQDGTTQGGFNLARADGTNLNLTGLAGVTTVTSVAIHGGTINNTTIGIGTSANGNFTNVKFVDGQVGSALSVGAATTFKEMLVVNGDARVTGILTVGTGTIIIDGDNSTISGVTGGTFTTVTGSTVDAQNLRAVAGVVTTLTATNATTADLNVTADARVGAALTVTGAAEFQSNVDLGDNDRLRFGDGTDLQIYHDGGNSLIVDSGTGNLYIAGDNSLLITNTSATETKAQFTTDGSVELYYDNAKKIETTAYGVDVTGTTGTDNLAVSGVSTFTGTIDVDGQAIFDDITVSAASTFTGLIDGNGGANISGGETILSSATVSDLTSGRVVLAGTSGALEDSGNLTFNGTTLSAPTADLTNATIDNLTFTSGTAITSVDTDLNAVSASDDTLASAKAIKTYVDAQITAQDLDFAGGTGTGAVDLDSQSLTIAGTTNEIETSASGQTLTIGLPNDVTITQDLTIGRDVLISRNLNVTGNVTIGGTSATIFASELKVADADIVLGIRTDGSGNDISNDTTANHGGVAVASTEGTPLVSLFNPGIGESNPATYKKIMWFKTGSFSGLGTDAWLSNYAIGIGSTQVPNGVVLAAGAVKITNNDISYVRNVSAASSITASTFFGDGSGLSNTGSTLSAASGSQRLVVTSQTSGTMTASATDADLTFDASTNTLSVGGNFELGHATDTTISRVSAGRIAVEGVNVVTTSSTDTLTNKTLTSPTLTTPVLGTPSSGTLTNCTGLPISTGVSGLAAGAATFLATPSSANLKTLVTDETGSGAVVFGTSPTLTTPAIGSGGFTLAGSTSGTTTVVAPAIASGTATFFSGSDTVVGLSSIQTLTNKTLTSPTLTTPVLGTPSSGTLTNCTGLPVSTGISGLGANVATFLATPSSANLASAVTDETGSGSLVFATSPTLVTPVLGTPSSGTLTNCTGLPISSGVSGLGANVATFLATPSSANLASAVTDETGSGSLVFGTSPSLTTPTIGGGGANFSGSTSGTLNLKAATAAGTGVVVTIPATTGTVITSGDSGTVTSTMIADGTIVNADINASAAIAVSKLAASTISGVTLGSNLNTLTMNTSGTGLSGSTTYNGSGAATFTVTSNATNANTGSTIVARDASGNFSAGTITATLSGNASTATSATSATTATNANNINLADETTDTTCFPVFATTATGNQAPKTAASLTFNSNTGALSATTVSGTSDIKLKENITTIENGLDKVCQLRGVEFDFKSSGQHSLGVIAQEIEQVLPDLVSEINGIKTVAYANITAVLIEAVKELKAEVAELRARLDG